MNLLQGLEEEPNEIRRRINQLIALQEKREEVYKNNHLLKLKFLSIINDDIHRTKNILFSKNEMIIESFSCLVGIASIHLVKYQLLSESSNADLKMVDESHQ